VTATTVLASTAVLESPGGLDNGLALFLVAVAAVFVFRGRSNLKAPTKSGKVSGLLMLGIVALIAFGLVWEISECAAGTHFGDPGDGSNPFDRFCPIDKTNGPGRVTP